jgi:hypothetical protein
LAGAAACAICVWLASAVAGFMADDMVEDVIVPSAGLTSVFVAAIIEPSAGLTSVFAAVSVVSFAGALEAASFFSSLQAASVTAMAATATALRRRLEGLISEKDIGFTCMRG